MLKTAKSKAEEQFTATQKKEQQARVERETEQREKAAHVAKLRALRLAKEAEDKLIADQAAAEKAAAKAAKKPALPRTHRRNS